MVDVETRPVNPPDRTTRSAALWATVVAVPVAVLVGFVAFAMFRPAAEPAASPAATASAPVVAVPSAPVEMAAPALSGRTAQACLALTSQLPAQVRNLPARQVSAGPEQNAAYGEPPLTVACGIAQPQMCEKLGETGCVPLDTELLIMNQVCWYAARSGADATFTTMDREVPVRVTVPASYEQPAQWANEFSDAVVQTVRSRTEGVPSGCGG